MDLNHQPRSKSLNPMVDSQRHRRQRKISSARLGQFTHLGVGILENLIHLAFIGLKWLTRVDGRLWKRPLSYLRKSLRCTSKESEEFKKIWKKDEMIWKKVAWDTAAKWCSASESVTAKTPKSRTNSKSFLSGLPASSFRVFKWKITLVSWATWWLPWRLSQTGSQAVPPSCSSYDGSHPDPWQWKKAQAPDKARDWELDQNDQTAVACMLLLLVMCFNCF